MRLAPTHRAKAFTLIELLVVIAIVAVISSLLMPAVQGLMGTSGRRGGLGTAAAVLEQARLCAIENGTSAYVGFPIHASDKTNGFSSLIVFRDPRPDETSTNAVPVTRWQRLPAGIFFEPDASLTAVLQDRTFAPRVLPRLGNEEIGRVAALRFNRFGQLPGANQEVILRLGEKILPSGAWKAGTNNHFALRVQPLTGRVVIKDMATSSP